MASSTGILDKIRGRLRPRADDARSTAVAIGVASATGIACRRSGDRLVIERAVAASLPPAPEEGAPAEAWTALSGQGLPPAPSIVAIARDGALVSSTVLPADDEAEFRAMARLALARELLSDGIDALSDFQVVRREAGQAELVLAAVPRAALAPVFARLGDRAARASLRALGVLALLRTRGSGAGAATLSVDLTDDAVEFTLVAGGCVRHSRSATLAGLESDRLGEVVAEFRRCFAALRSVEGMPAPEEILLLADREESRTLASALATVAGCPIRRLESHPLVELPSGGAREISLARAWPLIGLLLDDPAAVRRDGSALDLLHPTLGIDVAARNRQAALAVAGLAIVGALAGWTLGARGWEGLESRRDDLAAKARGALPELRRYKRDELRVRHLDATLAIAPDWLGHLDALRRFAPDPATVVLDGINAQITGTEIEYTPKGEFVARPEIRFVLDGEAKDRETADALRDAFVKTKGYTLGSTGADSRGGRRLPNPFAYTLRTADLAPSDPTSAPAETSRPAAGGAS